MERILRSVLYSNQYQIGHLPGWIILKEKREKRKEKREKFFMRIAP
jgi:hypothetical protein